MIKWQKVEWKDKKELLTLLMDGAELHLLVGADRCMRLDTKSKGSPFKVGNRDMEFDDWEYTFGYIKNEVEWFDVVSEDNKMILVNKEHGGFFMANSISGDPLRYRPATLDELKSMVWECMKDE